MSKRDAVIFPQFFWASVALLHTDCEQHFSLAVRLVRILLGLLSDEEGFTAIAGAMPGAWKPFTGFQHLLVGGFVSEQAESDVVIVLSMLLSIPASVWTTEDDPFQFFAALLVLSVWLSTDAPLNKSVIAIAVADRLSNAASARKMSSIAAACRKLVEGSTIKAEEFLSDVEDSIAKAICASA
jgi:hypothetical protein